MLKRPRRNRRTPAIRRLVEETHLTADNLVQPFFVTEGPRSSIASLPGIDRLPIDDLVREASELFERGLPAVILFPVIPPELKDPTGSEAHNPEGLLPRAVEALKRELPDLCVMADIALDPYTSHGHDGWVNEQGEILNDPTVSYLAQCGVMLGQAGVDLVAPSDMMDGRVRAIREALDHASLEQVGILSYAAKYASAYYGPFREALGSAPRFGDKKSYQMNPANRREALLEVSLDEEEGADVVMVKPALPYLDVIREVRESTQLPVAAYHVSGEYSMLIAAEQNGWIDGERCLLETLTCIKRAGADFILSYGTARVLKRGLLERSVEAPLSRSRPSPLCSGR